MYILIRRTFNMNKIVNLIICNDSRKTSVALLPADLIETLVISEYLYDEYNQCEKIISYIPDSFSRSNFIFSEYTKYHVVLDLSIYGLKDLVKGLNYPNISGVLFNHSIEGAENLYIINNRNNKKFKISLEEIL